MASLSTYYVNKQYRILLGYRTTRQEAMQHMQDTTQAALADLSPSPNPQAEVELRFNRNDVLRNNPCAACKQTHLCLAPDELKGNKSNLTASVVHTVEPNSLIPRVPYLRLRQHFADSQGNVGGGGRSCGGCSLRPVV